MNIGNTNDDAIPLTADLNDAVQLLVTKGGYELEDLAPLPTWLERGDDIIVFANHDLGSLANRALYTVMPWERSELTPKQAPDTDAAGLGWRYLPCMRVTA